MRSHPGNANDLDTRMVNVDGTRSIEPTRAGHRRQRRALAGMSLLVSSLSLSCGNESQPAVAASASGGQTGGFAGAAGVAGGSGGSAGSAGSTAVPDPGLKEMHQLNTAEYNATVADVLGTTFQPGNATWRSGELSGFDNMASVQGIDEAQYDRYFDAAITLTTEVFADPELRARFVACDAADPACVRTSLQTAGLRLFRRPLETDELITYERVHQQALALGDTPLAALELAFQALLSSAEFIYRIEFDPDPWSTDAHPLSPYELASRLSYFLWSSAPDERLLQAAANGSLSQPDTLLAETDRLFKDSKSERFISQFAGQWLGARRVLSHPVSPDLFYWNANVASAAGDEMLHYFADFARSERSWFEFPLADVNFVNDWLAAFYGMPSVQELTRVEYQGDSRVGFFGLAGFLAITSYDRRTSPSLRGYWISSTMLCTEPGLPPPDVPKLPGDDVDPTMLNVREVLEQHRQNPACVGCHSLFDHYGLALEEYDAVGLFRTTYPNGAMVNASAMLPPSDAHPEGLPFEGLSGLAAIVAADPQFGRCLAEKLLTYGLGRPVEASDEPHLERALQNWLVPDQAPSIRRLVHALVATEAFGFRRGESAPPEQP
jgi:hypothetical protein